jgi:hypothetical protein
MATSVPVHRYPDVGLGERRRIVDPVTSHGPAAARRLQPLDDGALLLRQDVRLDLVDAELARHGLGGPPVVAREQNVQATVRSLSRGENPALRRAGPIWGSDDVHRTEASPTCRREPTVNHPATRRVGSSGALLGRLRVAGTLPPRAPNTRRGIER